MRRFWVRSLLVLCGALGGTAFAQGVSDQDRAPSGSGRPVRHLSPQIIVPYRVTHSVQSPAPPAAPPAAPNAQSEARSDGAGHHDHHHDRHRHGDHNSWWYGGGYPLVWPYWSAPSVVAYYPIAVDSAPLANFVPAPAPQPAGDVGPRGRPKPTSAEQKAKAGKFIGFGDANFAHQKYLAAIERYKIAMRLAPDLAESFLRQGHALVALGQYESAVRAFKRGLRIRSDWTGTPVRLDQLYGQDQLAKTSHLENLAKAVEANPLDATLLWALGMQLFFNGEPERASVFFARVAQLGGNDEGLLNDFLPKPAPAGAPQPAGGAGKVVF